MKYYIFLLAFLPSLVCAQTWDLELGGYYLLNKVELEERVSEFTFDTPLLATQDSVQRQTIRSVSRLGSAFMSRPGLNIGVGRTKEVTNKLSYRLGGGLMLRSLNRRDSFEFVSQEILNEEIVAAEDGSNIINTSSLCDRFTNSTADLGVIDRTELINVYYLNLNASINYDVVEDVVALFGGVELRTPLFSLRQRDRIAIDQEEIEDEIVCTLRNENYQDRSGNDFRNANLSLNLGGTFSIEDGLSVQVGLSQELQGMFVYPPSEFNFQRDQLLPTELFIKVRYTLGGNKSKLPIDSM